MSKVTTIYNKIVEKLDQTFSSKTRIPNAYSLPDNDDNFLVDGYGLIIGEASFEPFEFCSFVVNRTISVVFTKEIVRLDSSFTEYDSTIPQMLEGVYTLQELFYNYNELGIEASILKVDIGSTSGIETVIGSKNNFYSMTASFAFSIKEEFLTGA